MAADSARRPASGFTLIEVIVILAILAAIAGVIVTQVVPRIFQGQAGALGSSLSGLNGAISSFRQDVGRYPLKLTQLDSPIVATSRDLCEVLYPAVFLTRWKGPYTDRGITSAGVAVGDAVIRDSIGRQPLNPATPGFGEMFIFADNVDTTVYAALDMSFDGSNTPTTGAIRWTETGTTNLGTLSYVVPVRGC